MSRQASPAVIGGFVVGAFVLAVAGILVFGSGRFFANIDRVVMYFPGDLQGLRVGAAVDFQGVPIGTVVKIKAAIDPQNVEVHLPVIVELHPDTVEFVTPRPEGEKAIQNLVERGVRPADQAARDPHGSDYQAASGANGTEGAREDWRAATRRYL